MITAEDKIKLKIEFGKDLTVQDIFDYCDELGFNTKYNTNCIKNEATIIVKITRLIYIKYHIDIKDFICIKTKCNEDLIEGFYKLQEEAKKSKIRQSEIDNEMIKFWINFAVGIIIFIFICFISVSIL